MKGCILAGVILLLVIGGVIFNAVYIRNTTNELLTAVSSLPSIPDPARTPSEIAVIRDKLERHAPILGITITYATIDRVSEALINLASYARTDDRLQYAATLALLHDLIEELARTERINIENIL